ncbi:MAG TPA: hypothetical protein VF268_15330 [Gammaproteobacteria bacterium]
MRAEKEGLTPSERYLGRLCRRSFLSPWSYQNLHTDEGRKSASVPGHELCDLLVVFGDTVIIFSDKHVAFHEKKPIEVAWPRWFRKAVRKSVRQLHGAESWVRNHPDRIFLDPLCVNPFPIPLPSSNKIDIHLVAVATGAYEACYKYFGRQSIGSLMLATDLYDTHHEKVPFTVGWVDSKRKFVHVFDEFSLDAVFGEIDTISDFVAYLEKRESFLTKRTPIIRAPGEEQLLAIYLTKMNECGEHDFVIPNAGGENPDLISFDESFWQGMVNDQQYKRKKLADRISYAWDRLIEHFVALGGAYDRNFQRSESVADIEIGLRHMAAESRLSRRQLASAFVDLLKTTPSDKRKARVVYSNEFPTNAYVFLVLPKIDGESYDIYRQNRVALLSAYCQVAKLRCEKAQYIIGIATESYRAEGASEDLVVLDVRDWNDELNDEAKRLQSEGGLLLAGNVRTQEGRTLEYPAESGDSTASSFSKRQKDPRKLRKKRNMIQKNSRKKNRRK